MKKNINKIRLTESQLHNLIKVSVKRVLKEVRRNIDFTTSDIWQKYNLPWNDVDDTPEHYQGEWYISVNFFDYTYCLGTEDIDESFSSLQDCLDYAQNLSQGDLWDLFMNDIGKYNEETEDYDTFDYVSLNINCRTNKGVYEVANTRPFMPNH